MRLQRCLHLRLPGLLRQRRRRRQLQLRLRLVPLRQRSLQVRKARRGPGQEVQAAEQGTGKNDENEWKIWEQSDLILHTKCLF